MGKSNLPDSKGDLQEGAEARDEENAVDEVTLGQAVVLEAQPLRKNERNRDSGPKRCQKVLQGERKQRNGRETQMTQKHKKHK